LARRDRGDAQGRLRRRNGRRDHGGVGDNRPIIPPSLPMIVYGVAAETSVGALFIAGVIPAC